MYSTLNMAAKQSAVHIESMEQLSRSRNRACLLVLMMIVCCVCLSAAVAVLSHIHTVVPVIAVIDDQGHVVKQDLVSSENFVADKRIVQSEVYQFITYCNTYDPLWRQHYADLCRLHASKEVAAQYTREISPQNQSSPYLLIGKEGRLYPKITAIHQIGDQAYQVSYQMITERAGAVIKTDYYHALIRYVFTRQPLSLRDRWENALGFAVTSYRKEAELSLSEGK